MSPVIQALIDKGLIDRIPVSFSAYFFDQMKDWETLFPAERRYFERLFTLLDRLPEDEFADLFTPLRATEAKMGVSEKTWPRRTFTLDQVDFLNRNAHYPEWRREVATIFSRVDPVLDAETARRGRPRVVVVVTPPDVPVGPDRLWTRLTGRRVSLESPLDPAKHLAPLLSRSAVPYDRWLVQAAAEIPAQPGVVSLSYESLERYRRRLADEVQTIVEKEQIKGPRELGARLKKLKILAGESDVAGDPILAEFLRAVLLAGNGTLLINNTFVEWATLQAVRRAKPSVCVAAFGIRNKMKPFSSLLIYADQEKASPVPTQVDTLGTYVDLEVFYQYIWQEFEKYAEYARNTVYLYVAAGMDEALLIAPADFQVPDKAAPDALAALAAQWIGQTAP